jgi:hypothetical protein
MPNQLAEIGWNNQLPLQPMIALKQGGQGEDIIRVQQGGQAFHTKLPSNEKYDRLLQKF